VDDALQMPGESYSLQKIQARIEIHYEAEVELMNGILTVVERHPDKVSGALVFCGTRVSVATLFENLKDGASIDDFLDWFPGVTRVQVETLLDHEMAVLTNLIEA
jgi:uncharacterized protein (DUF433 family)